VKNVILILLVLAIAGLFTHGKKLSDDLDKANDDNAQLTQQVATYQSEYADLQSRYRQLTAQAAAIPYPNGAPARMSGGPVSSIQGANPLDKPAYH